MARYRQGLRVRFINPDSEMPDEGVIDSVLIDSQRPTADPFDIDEYLLRGSDGSFYEVINDEILGLATPDNPPNLGGNLVVGADPVGTVNADGTFTTGTATVINGGINGAFAEYTSRPFSFTVPAQPREEPLPAPPEDAPFAQFGAGILAADYTPRRGATRFFRFRIPVGGEGIVLTPAVIWGEYKFIDANGRVWVNQFQDPEVRNGRRLFDELDIAWMKESDLVLQRARQQLSNPTKLNSKKLRRKYGDMPVIKEESYYASKKYIA